MPSRLAPACFPWKNKPAAKPPPTHLYEPRKKPYRSSSCRGNQKAESRRQIAGTPAFVCIRPTRRLTPPIRADSSLHTSRALTAMGSSAAKARRRHSTAAMVKGKPTQKSTSHTTPSTSSMVIGPPSQHLRVPGETWGQPVCGLSVTSGSPLLRHTLTCFRR